MSYSHARIVSYENSAIECIILLHILFEHSVCWVHVQGDANIRFYELSNEAPFISYLNESSGHKAHTTVCALPKRGLSVSQCEIMRIFRVDATQLVIEPLSFIVPRRVIFFVYAVESISLFIHFKVFISVKIQQSYGNRTASSLFDKQLVNE